jgi:5-methylcytosine-specific restriction endonuclease McrA
VPKRVRVPVKEETRWRGQIPHRVKAYVFARDAYTCRYCGASGEGVILEPDHVIPSRLYGPGVVWNIVTACFPCNRNKGGHTLTCWQSGKGCLAAVPYPCYASAACQ